MTTLVQISENQACLSLLVLIRLLQLLTHKRLHLHHSALVKCHPEMQTIKRQHNKDESNPSTAAKLKRTWWKLKESRSDGSSSGGFGFIWKTATERNYTQHCLEPWSEIIYTFTGAAVWIRVSLSKLALWTFKANATNASSRSVGAGAVFCGRH